MISLTGCDLSTSSDPDVHPAIVTMVESLKADRDCVGLQAAFDRTDDADELSYIDKTMRSIGCYG